MIYVLLIVAFVIMSLVAYQYRAWWKEQDGMWQGDI